MKETTWTLVLVTTSAGDWTASHLDPMLDAIEHADHVVGRRRTGRWSSLVRFCKSLPWRIRYAVPVSDLDSPCRLHRVEALSALYLEANGAGLPLEILAKATYLGQLIDEVSVPSITSANQPDSSKSDRAWARRPRIVGRVSERSS
jgi:hypothetical protein